MKGDSSRSFPTSPPKLFFKPDVKIIRTEKNPAALTPLPRKLSFWPFRHPPPQSRPLFRPKSRSDGKATTPAHLDVNICPRFSFGCQSGFHSSPSPIRAYWDKELRNRGSSGRGSNWDTTNPGRPFSYAAPAISAILKLPLLPPTGGVPRPAPLKMRRSAHPPGDGDGAQSFREECGIGIGAGMPFPEYLPR